MRFCAAKMNNGQDISAEKHLPHQIIFKAWALSQETVYGGGLCADTMGMGETYDVISQLEMMPKYWEAEHLKQEEPKPLVVRGSIVRQKKAQLERLTKHAGCSIWSSDKARGGIVLLNDGCALHIS